MTVFAPEYCLFAGYPWVWPKPYLVPWDNGPYVGYAQGVLKCKFSNTSWNPPNPPIAPPYWFDGALYQGLIVIQAWLKSLGNAIEPTGHLDTPTWQMLDYFAVNT